MEVLGALGVNGPFLLAQIVNFLILFGALSLLLWKPMLKMLNERKQRIAQGLAEAVRSYTAQREVVSGEDAQQTKSR